MSDELLHLMGDFCEALRTQARYYRHPLSPNAQAANVDVRVKRMALVDFMGASDKTEMTIHELHMSMHTSIYKRRKP